jgi:arginine decarboxylase
LGDLHNLFGDTNTVHVSISSNGRYHLEEVVTGDTVTDVLEYVSYSRSDLVARLRRSIEEALQAGRLTLEASGHLLRIYEDGLSGYTYLQEKRVPMADTTPAMAHAVEAAPSSASSHP